MEITGVNNELVKQYAKLQQKKYRTESGKFILEGYKAIKEAYDYNIKIEKIFVNKLNLADYAFAKDLIVETNEAVLKKLSQTQTPPPAVAVGFQKKYNLEIFKDLKKVILLENIKDVGNLGTIIRSAVAFNCEGIVLFGDCADLYNPKCVRAAVGNLWKLPIIQIDNLSDFDDIFSKYTKIATLPKSKNLLKSYNPKFPLLVMFGSEADGLSEDLIQRSTASVKIEMQEYVESLNLASSASVVMYELFV